jgi:hypothetical protein
VTVKGNNTADIIHATENGHQGQTTNLVAGRCHSVRPGDEILMKRSYGEFIRTERLLYVRSLPDHLHSLMKREMAIVTGMEDGKPPPVKQRSVSEEDWKNYCTRLQLSERQPVKPAIGTLVPVREVSWCTCATFLNPLLPTKKHQVSTPPTVRAMRAIGGAMSLTDLEASKEADRLRRVGLNPGDIPPPLQSREMTTHTGSICGSFGPITGALTDLDVCQRMTLTSPDIIYCFSSHVSGLLQKKSGALVEWEDTEANSLIISVSGGLQHIRRASQLLQDWVWFGTGRMVAMSTVPLSGEAVLRQLKEEEMMLAEEDGEGEYF